VFTEIDRVKQRMRRAGEEPREEDERPGQSLYFIAAAYDNRVGKQMQEGEGDPGAPRAAS
jgi:hypothetical protein